MTNPKEIVELLSETSVDSRISLKVVLDKWLLQQPLFRGTYTKKVTISALQKLFMMRDSRIESLMVIGYNPSHSNINSEVNAPFKILSTLLRFIENESQGPETNLGEYKMQRNKDMQHIGHGERLDTVEGHNDLYYDEEDGSGEEEKNQFDQMASDDDSEDENPDAEILGLVGNGLGKKSKKKGGSQEKIEVNLDDIEDEEDQECLLDYRQNDLNRQKPGDDASGLDPNLFKIKESKDKGLADMETGSEVYMSELLVSKQITLILFITGWI